MPLSAASQCSLLKHYGCLRQHIASLSVWHVWVTPKIPDTGFQGFQGYSLPPALAQQTHHRGSGLDTTTLWLLTSTHCITFCAARLGYTKNPRYGADDPTIRADPGQILGRPWAEAGQTCRNHHARAAARPLGSKTHAIHSTPDASKPGQHRPAHANMEQLKSMIWDVKV